MTLIAVLVDRTDVPTTIVQAVFIVSLGIVVGTLMLTQRKRLHTVIARLKPVQRAMSQPRVQKLYLASTGYTLGDVLKSALVSLPFTAMLILTQVLIACTVGVGLALKYFVLFVPLIALANMLPISFNELGVREGTYQLSFVPVGVSTATAVAISLAFHVMRLIARLLSGVVYIASGIREQLARQQDQG